jgi:hypothetical protein
MILGADMELEHETAIVVNGGHTAAAAGAPVYRG